MSGEGASMGNPGGSHSNESGTGSYDSTAGEPGEGPRSLIVSYLDKARGQYVTLDVIEPRYARPSTVGVKLPDVAFDIDGNASLRITATKRHKVSGVAVVDGANEQVAARDLVLRRAHLVRTGTDHTDALATPFVGGYIETLPGDVLELEFDGASQGSTNAYLLGFGGVYAPADRKAQRKAGNWTDTLDEQAIAMLAEVYHYSKR